jgi:uncharacterized protein YigE (DUF2233 family)
MRRQSLVVGACLACLACLAALAPSVAGCKRRDEEPARAHVPLPAGGAAVDEPDAGASLIEDARRYDVRTWSFALDGYEMRVVDAGMSTALDAVLARSDAELVVNGGFFDPQGKPVGLVMSELAMPDGARFAVQCRPRLVVNGAPNVKSDDGHRSERTALCLRDGGKAIDVVIVKGATSESPGPSLFALGKYLAQRGCEGALNLDGGPSTGVAWRENGAVRMLAPARPVRHAVSFRRRGA